MARRRKRALSPEDRALWDSVASSVSPLSPDNGRGGGALGETSEAPPEGANQPDMPRMDQPAHPGTRSFRVGQAAAPGRAQHDLAPTPAERLTAMAPRVDGHTMARLKRGRQKPEARIDLHGMTLAQAHPALTHFIHDAHANGRRLVLVITGKGRAGEGGPFTERGVLRRQVPIWLQSGSCARFVLQVLPAHIRHGGDGAYYVYLRRRA